VSESGAQRAQRWILAGALLAAFAADQVTKEMALHGLASGPTSFGGVRLRLVANRGILLGFPAPTLLIVLATVGVVVLALRSTRGQTRGMTVAYGLFAGGALGNLADRFQDRHLFPPNAVVDWIAAGRVTFNLADVILVVGLVLMLVLSETQKGDTGQRLVA
jgi:lipoprotein signal peptidase